MSATAPIAYFCAEFGVDARLPIYAGGLGVLAGDTLKQAADSQVSMVGIGLMYRGEGFVQRLTPEGIQEEVDQDFDPVRDGLEHVYVEGMPLFIKVHLTELDVWCRCWKKTLSPTVTLYLLDTETDQNEVNERSITHVLYSGTEESVIKQQLILGIGGVKLLHALNIHPELYHVQEGRPAFLHWQLIRHYMDEHGLNFESARTQAKNKTFYTNHTLVGAGNPSYDANLLKRYAQYYADKTGVSVETLLEPGIEQDPDRFYITRFALNTSTRASGVSQLHTKLSQDSWSGYQWVNITNGVHLPSWQDSQIPVVAADAERLWRRHLELKQQTMEYVKSRTGYGYDPNAMIITWSRRLAGYKRYGALFTEIERLVALLKNSDRPAHLLMSGKAHRLDVQGKQQLQEIIQYMQNELNGSALFIPNYDLDVARALVQGSDVWLNTPEQGKEACGTSGMKAVSNGVLQCTVLDGWAAEVDWQGIGWTLRSDQVVTDTYETLEQHIVPMFYTRTNGIPQEWVTRMQKSIALSTRFSAARMLAEYQQKLYQQPLV